jgi:hypothetical protein
VPQSPLLEAAGAEQNLLEKDMQKVPRKPKQKRQTSARVETSDESSDEGSGGGRALPPEVRAETLFLAASKFFSSATPLKPKRKKPRRKSPPRATKPTRLREDSGNDNILPADVQELNAALWDSDHQDDQGEGADEDDEMSDPCECASPEDDGEDTTTTGTGAPLQSSGTVTLKGTFEVESIRLGPNIAGKYLVHWEGHDADGDAWEPKENLPADVVAKHMEWRHNDGSDSN